MIYSVDTSALMGSWIRHYPPDVMPDFWEKIEGLVTRKVVFASIEVLRELDEKDDSIAKWGRQHKAMFLEADPQVQEEVGNIVDRFPGLLAGGRSRGDPWVIAMAKVHKSAVLTEEGHSPSLRRPHIPDVCDALQIKCINVLDFMRAQGWKFYSRTIE